MRLLLISNSTNAGEAYLEHALDGIHSFLGDRQVRALFIPYAGVGISYEDYAEKVRGSFREIGYDLLSIHDQEDPVKALSNAEAIVVGGGNTFHLVKCLHDRELTGHIRDQVLSGIPFIGWSAGSNIACPTLCTTNDMPIVEPSGFHTLNLVPFQINPHYLDAHPEGHAGETREMRILEFTEVNPGIYVVGLREGSLLRMEGCDLQLPGTRAARIFIKGREPFEILPGSDLSFLL